MPLPQNRRRLILAVLAAGSGAIALAGTVDGKDEPPLPGSPLPTVEAAAVEAPTPPRPPRPDLAPAPRARPDRPRPHPIEWRDSRPIGYPEAGSLERGVMLPSEGVEWVSWDPVEREKPNRWWRRWGTDRLLRTTLAIVRDYATEHPNAPRILIGDLSRPHGGDFGTRYGPIGHASHQNGLDVDVYYPRIDRREWTPRLPAQVDVELAQELVDRFVAAGAELVFVGPSLPLTGPAGVVVPLVNHDNHLHARLPAD